jgi:mannose-6-phosphate isomerase-like protein (cupin superfamily)
MQKVIKLEEIEPVEIRPGLFVRALAVVDNFSVVLVESPPGNYFQVAHPEAEFVYVLRGQADYDDGRSAKAGDSVINLPNMPHPFRTVGEEPMVILEIKSPPPPLYVDLLKTKRGLRPSDK